MPTTIRLSKKEQKDIELKCRYINKTLIGMEVKPISESELVHKIISEAIPSLEVTKSGDIKIIK